MTIILCVTFQDGVTVFQRVKKATDYLHTLSRSERKLITRVAFHN